MYLQKLAEAIDAHVVVAGANPGPVIDSVYAGDRMSDLLSHSGDGTLLVTSLASRAMPRLFELLDVPVICLVGDVEPDDDLVRAAGENGGALVVSPYGLFETCGRIYAAMKLAAR